MDTFIFHFISSHQYFTDLTELFLWFVIHNINIMDEMIEQVAPTNVSLDDLEELINSLSPDEVAELAECDPDVRKIEMKNLQQKVT